MSEDALSRRVWSIRRLRARLDADEAGGGGGGGGSVTPKKAVCNLTTTSGGLSWEIVSDEIGLTDEPKGHALELPGSGFCSVLAQILNPGAIPAADADCLAQWLTAVAIEIDSDHHDSAFQAAGAVEFTASGATPAANASAAQIAGSVEVGKVLCPSLLVRYNALTVEGVDGSATPDGSIIQTTILFWTYSA